MWRAVLVERGDRASLAATRAVLASFLDTLAASPDPVGAQLEAIVDKFVADRVAGAELDWRYYLVRCPCMREGNSGIYYGADHALGYELTMLRKLRQSARQRASMPRAQSVPAARVVSTIRSSAPPAR